MSRPGNGGGNRRTAVFTWFLGTAGQTQPDDPLADVGAAAAPPAPTAVAATAAAAPIVVTAMRCFIVYPSSLPDRFRIDGAVTSPYPDDRDAGPLRFTWSFA
ncbi:hypothetical protein [Gordonia sp. (in: high G+C Gram-positive bacteria)]|uniref:hypothetical protein n=1 Tax=Gordonia sp. (in: high G+C Gram-positive bacteria) TaxID=84139 RepID=UPI003C795E97